MTALVLNLQQFHLQLLVLFLQSIILLLRVVQQERFGRVAVAVLVDFAQLLQQQVVAVL